MTDIGAPYGITPPKRSFDSVPVGLDWHDYLVNLWLPGTYYSGDAVIRNVRAFSTGKQYRALSDGVSGGGPPLFVGSDVSPAPKHALGDQFEDGTILWVAEEISVDSLRSPIASEVWVIDAGITTSTPQVSNLLYILRADGGTNGIDYNFYHRITLANGEKKEGRAVLPVRD